MKNLERPVLTFDLKKIEKRMAVVSQLARRSGCKLLFPVKSFPHPEIFKLAAHHLDGFDVSNENEFKQIRGYLSKRHELWVSGPVPTQSQALIRRASGIACQSQYGLKSKPIPFSQTVFRLDSSHLLQDPRQGRFGWLFENLDFLRPDQKSVSLSIHHGMQDTKVSHLLQLFSAVNKACLEKKLSCERFNLGGGWRDFSLQDVRRLFTELQILNSFLKHPAEIFLEPGRWWFEDFGQASAKILDIRSFPQGWDITLDISSGCHLKWSRPKFQLPANWTTTKNKILRFWGPTCSEQDLIYETKGALPQGKLPQQFILKNISGYSVAWNHSFNGIPEAKIEFKK